MRPLMTLIAVVVTGLAVMAFTPPKHDDGPKRTLVHNSTDEYLCAQTATGKSCRSAADVYSFLVADDRECH